MECLEKKENTLNILKEMRSPRVIKTHLPASVLPTDLWKQKSKVIYVARNVKDSLVSSYHYFTGLGIFPNTLSLEAYVAMFMNNKLPYHPFWQHNLEFYEMRNQPNVFFTSYERMSKDIRSVIKELCVYLGKPIPDESVLDEAEKHLNFENMKSEYEE